MVTGHVVDTEGSPVVGARVLFEEIASGDRYLSITGEGGAYAVSLGSRNTGVRTTDPFPRSSKLHQNYPNPFNPVTTIRFELPQPVDTRLVVYDILGRRVKTLIDDRLPPGLHNARWDGSADGGNGVAAGVYLYRLTTPSFTESRKMLLLDGAMPVGVAHTDVAGRAPAARRTQARTYAVRVTSRRLETYTLERFSVEGDAVLEIENITRRRGTQFAEEDVDGDGQTDLLTMLDADAAREVRIRDLDRDGKAELFADLREEFSARGTLVSVWTQIVESGDSVWVWSTVLVETTGMSPAALHLRLQLDQTLLSSLSMADARQFAQQQAGSLVPRASATGPGILRIEIPERLLSESSEITLFDHPHIIVAEKPTELDWSYCGPTDCTEPYLIVSSSPQGKRDAAAQFDFEIESSFSLAPDNLHLVAVSPDGEVAELRPLLESETQTDLNGREMWEYTVLASWQPSQTGLNRLRLRIEKEGVVFSESLVWHLQTQRPLLELDLIGGTRHSMVHVAAGPFEMGSDRGFTNERPEHRVDLEGFYLDLNEVTNQQWNAYAAFLGIAPKSEANDHPVTNVSWTEAQEYCRWAGLRLPTEAEWEKGARGTDGRTYPWGETIDGSHANYVDSGDSFDNNTTPVGLFPEGRSPYGALDMAGNVWEWAEDWFDENYYASSPARNPSGPSGGIGRVLRGGSWLNLPLSLRSSHRGGRDPADRTNFIGFRCARNG